METIGITETIILGVLSGVLASFALILLGQIFHKLIVPWYEEISYKGIDIGGEWGYSISYKSGNSSNFFVQIDQSAEKIKCTISETKTIKKTDNTESRIFEYNGNLSDRFLTLTGRNTNRKKLGVYTFLLEVKGDGDKLEGVVSRYCLSDCVIKSDNVIWTRK